MLAKLKTNIKTFVKGAGFVKVCSDNKDCPVENPECNLLGYCSSNAVSQVLNGMMDDIAGNKNNIRDLGLLIKEKDFLSDINQSNLCTNVRCTNGSDCDPVEEGCYCDGVNNCNLRQILCMVIGECKDKCVSSGVGSGDTRGTCHGKYEHCYDNGTCHWQRP